MPIRTNSAGDFTLELYKSIRVTEYLQVLSVVFVTEPIAHSLRNEHFHKVRAHEPEVHHNGLHGTGIAYKSCRMDPISIKEVDKVYYCLVCPDLHVEEGLSIPKLLTCTQRLK